MVYPCIPWIQVFIILFHRNAPELPFNRWIFGNVFVVDVPIFGYGKIRQSIPVLACLRDRHANSRTWVQLDNLWIIMNYLWLRMLCKVLLAVLRRTCKIFRTDSALHILTATNLLTRQKDRNDQKPAIKGGWFIRAKSEHDQRKFH